jgi:hypothetical protein
MFSRFRRTPPPAEPTAPETVRRPQDEWRTVEPIGIGLSLSPTADSRSFVSTLNSRRPASTGLDRTARPRPPAPVIGPPLASVVARAVVRPVAETEDLGARLHRVRARRDSSREPRHRSPAVPPLAADMKQGSTPTDARGPSVGPSQDAAPPLVVQPPEQTGLLGRLRTFVGNRKSGRYETAVVQTQAPPSLPPPVVSRAGRAPLAPAAGPPAQPRVIVSRAPATPASLQRQPAAGPVSRPRSHPSAGLPQPAPGALADAVADTRPDDEPSAAGRPPEGDRHRPPATPVVSPPGAAARPGAASQSPTVPPTDVRGPVRPIAPSQPSQAATGPGPKPVPVSLARRILPGRPNPSVSTLEGSPVGRPQQPVRQTPVAVARQAGRHAGVSRAPVRPSQDAVAQPVSVVPDARASDAPPQLAADGHRDRPTGLGFPRRPATTAHREAVPTGHQEPTVGAESRLAAPGLGLQRPVSVARAIGERDRATPPARPTPPPRAPAKPALSRAVTAAIGPAHSLSSGGPVSQLDATIPADALVASGVARQAADDSLEFVPAPGARTAAQPVTPVDAATPGPSRSADLGVLADEVYERIEHRLRADLLGERERNGRLADPLG